MAACGDVLSVDEGQTGWRFAALAAGCKIRGGEAARGLASPHAHALPSCTAPTVETLYSGSVHSDCPYAQRHWDTAFRKRPWWKLQPADSAAPRQLMVDEYEVIDWDAVMAPPHLVVNNYCVRKGLSRKAHFAKYMRRYAEKHADSILHTAIPETVLIDTVPVFVSRPAYMDFKSAMAEVLIDAEEAMDAASAAYEATRAAQQTTATCAGRAAADMVPTWILKPSLANKGAEVFIVQDMAAVKAAISEWRDVGQWVLQRYVERPLLLNGRKFHIRLYVLADGALSVHVFREALLLVAVEKYNADIHARHAHITNTCANVEHAAFDERDFVRRLSELPQLLLAQGSVGSHAEGVAAGERVWRDMCAAVRDAFLAFVGDFNGFMPLANAFELYGVDFLVTEDLGVVLLEFNPTPDIAQTGSRLDYMIEALIEGVAATAIDRRFPPPPAPCHPAAASSIVSVHAAPGFESLRFERVLEKAWPSSNTGVNVRMS